MGKFFFSIVGILLLVFLLGCDKTTDTNSDSIQIGDDLESLLVGTWVGVDSLADNSFNVTDTIMFLDPEADTLNYSGIIFHRTISFFSENTLSSYISYVGRPIFNDTTSECRLMFAYDIITIDSIGTEKIMESFENIEFNDNIFIKDDTLHFEFEWSHIAENFERKKFIKL
jgi:hypothetical protein